MPASTGERGRIVLRVDVSAEIGLGHAMRSITLGAELADAGWAATLCGSGIDPQLVAGTAVDVSACAPSSDAAPVLDLQPDLVVIDGYRFTADLYDAIDDAGVPYAVVDDDGRTPAPRPVAVVNQNPHATPGMYRDLPGSPRLLLGPDHALVRREVRQVAAAGGPGVRRSGVFVAFGGSDPRGLTVPVALALADAGHPVRVAVGPAHGERANVVATLSALAGITVVEPGAYVSELAVARVAVLAAGTSLWESACLGTPTVAVVVAANQRDPAAAALERGLVRAVVAAGDGGECDRGECDGGEGDERRGVVASICRAVGTATVGDGDHDPPPVAWGDGARRVTDALGDILDGPLRCRPATAGDAAFLFDLRTDPDVDRASFSPAPNWDEHVAWLGSVVTDPAIDLLIVERGGLPIGQLRLDATPDRRDRRDDRVVSIAIDRRFRGRGAGVAVLRWAGDRSPTDLVARIKADNVPSIEAFTRAGFRGAEPHGGEVVMHRPAPAGEERS